MNPEGPCGIVGTIQEGLRKNSAIILTASHRVNSLALKKPAPTALTCFNGEWADYAANTNQTGIVEFKNVP